MVFLVGTAIQSYGSLGVPVAVTAAVFVLGLILPAVRRGDTGQGHCRLRSKVQSAKLQSGK